MLLQIDIVFTTPPLKLCPWLKFFKYFKVRNALLMFLKTFSD